MTSPSTLIMERNSPRLATITFSNPPANVTVVETVTRLIGILDEFEKEPDLQVVVFKSAVPDFFLNHFNLAEVGNLPVPAAGALPIWTELVVRLSNASFITIASIRGRTRGAGNEFAMACDLRYASLEKAKFGQPEVGAGLVPGGGATERLPRFIGRDRALEVILSSSDYDAALAEHWGWVTRALPDAELDGFVDAMAARLASFDKNSLITAKAMVNRATLPPEASLVAAFQDMTKSLALPGFTARAARTPPMSAEQFLDFELRMGEYIGFANQRASS